MYEVFIKPLKPREASLSIKESDDEEGDEEEETNSKIIHISDIDHTNLVPRFSPTRRETLVGPGHVSPRIWEITNKRFGGGADKCEICLCRA